MAFEIANIVCKDVALINCVATVSDRPLLEPLGDADEPLGNPDVWAEASPLTTTANVPPAIVRKGLFEIIVITFSQKNNTSKFFIAATAHFWHLASEQKDTEKRHSHPDSIRLNL